VHRILRFLKSPSFPLYKRGRIWISSFSKEEDLDFPIQQRGGFGFPHSAKRRIWISSFSKEEDLDFPPLLKPIVTHIFVPPFNKGG
jgi:hypothetical protein